MVKILSRKFGRPFFHSILSALWIVSIFISPPAMSAWAEDLPAPPQMGDSQHSQIVSAGQNHACGVTISGSIECWGDNTNGQISVPAPNSDFTQVSTGMDHTCGIKNDGTVVCWGLNGNGQATPPGGTFVQISAGRFHTCGLRSDGSLACWGRNDAGQTNVPAPNSEFTHVSAGTWHSCARKLDGSLVCWGDNFHGQSTIPSPNTGFAQVSAGRDYTCGLRADGSIVCWGLDTYNQSSVPTPNSNYTQVSAGDDQVCARRSDSSVVCWGDAYRGVPPPNSGFVQVSSGDEVACGLMNDRNIVCWGDNNMGQLENPGFFVEVSAGSVHTCGRRLDGTVDCWGDNLLGQTNVPFPNSNFDQIDAGGIHTCGVKSDTSIVCWGSNWTGELNITPPNTNYSQVSGGIGATCARRTNGTVECWDASVFVTVSNPIPNSSIAQVSRGSDFSCVLRNDDSLDCWGPFNAYGQLNVPALSPNFRQVAAGEDYACARWLSGIECWGRNDAGEATNPDQSRYYVDLETGWNHTCAIYQTMGPIPNWPVVCWGNNSSGQLNAPVASTASGFQDVAVGMHHSCGVTTSGNITCWGSNTYGQSTQPTGIFALPAVNQPPTANNDAYSLLEDGVLTVDAVSGVLANDSDPESAALFAFEDTGPSLGVSSLATDGSFTYSPNPNECVTDSFTYHATDGLSDSASATVDLTITCVNDAPSVSASDPPAVLEDAGAQTVSNWATFSPGPSNESTQTALQFTVTNVSNPGLFAVGPTVGLTGTLYYTPAANTNGTSTFDVQVQDDGGTANGGVDLSASQTFTIIVNSVGDQPTTSGITDVIVNEDAPDTIIDLWPSYDDIEDSDTDLTFTVTNNTNAGLFSSVTIDTGPDRYLTLDYGPDENGSADLTIRATDTDTQWVETTFTVTINPVNDAPSFSAGSDLTVPVNSSPYSAPWASSITSGPSNESGQTVAFVASNDNNALFLAQPSINSSGVLSFTPAPGIMGSALVDVVLTDDGGTTNGGDDSSPLEQFTITVAPFPQVIDVRVSSGGVQIPPGGTVIANIAGLSIDFDLDVDNPGGNALPDDVTNPVNFMLLQTGPNGIYDTPQCLGGVVGDDIAIPVNGVTYNSFFHRASVGLNNGARLPNGDYRLCVCGTTSVTAGGIPLGGDGLNPGTDFILDFSVQVPPALPQTGFPAQEATVLPYQPPNKTYDTYAGMWLSIPGLEINSAIVGVPFVGDDWNVTWLNGNIGWLEGTAFPTWSGNSVLTGHVIEANGLSGPMADLQSLRYGDQIIIHAWGQGYVYEVQSVSYLDPAAIQSAFTHENQPWLTLLTCHGAYDESHEDYRWRLAVRAVLVAID